MPDARFKKMEIRFISLIYFNPDSESGERERDREKKKKTETERKRQRQREKDRQRERVRHVQCTGSPTCKKIIFNGT